MVDIVNTATRGIVARGIVGNIISQDAIPGDVVGNMAVNPQRNILTFNGINIDAVLQTPSVLTVSDTTKLVFASTTTGTTKDLLDGVLQFDASDLLQLTNCTTTIDGNTVADGASIAAYLDGKVHTIVITMTGSDTVTYIGQNGFAANFYKGEIFSVEFTVSGVVTNYVLDNGSTTIQYARGHVSPSTKYVTYNNVAISDWEYFIFNPVDNWWEGIELVVDGGFDTVCGVNWLCGSPWSIGSSKATTDGIVQGNLTQSIFTIGNHYVAKVNIQDYIDESLNLYIGSSTFQLGLAGDGQKIFSGQCAGSGDLILQSVLNADFSLDNAAASRILRLP